MPSADKERTKDLQNSPSNLDFTCRNSDPDLQISNHATYFEFYLKDHAIVLLLDFN